MHWRNSNFQIMHFIAGRCHTADEAYRVLMELREERDLAILNFEAGVKRKAAKKDRAERVLRSWFSSRADKLDARADLAEIAAFEGNERQCLDQAIRERGYIDNLIEMIGPLRKYADLPDHAAHQACQREEWRLELINRAKTHLLSQRTIPADQLDVMRMHPDFADAILPAIQKISGEIASGNLAIDHRPKILME